MPGFVIVNMHVNVEQMMNDMGWPKRVTLEVRTIVAAALTEQRDSLRPGRLDPRTGKETEPSEPPIHPDNIRLTTHDISGDPGLHHFTADYTLLVTGVHMETTRDLAMAMEIRRQLMGFLPKARTVEVWFV